jgi:membrane protein implicated in regulation of membrane protease activity
MNWENVYLGSFAVGFFLSLVSFAGSAMHLPKGFHFGHGAHGHVHGPLSWLNFGSITIFLAWFGAAGYLLTRHSSLFAVATFGIAALIGCLGASCISWFLMKFLLAHDFQLDAADYDMIGVLGRVTSAVQGSGTGEMIYSQAGVRRAASIRSDSGGPLAKDTEVVVTRYERGIAYVRPWDELNGLTASASRK